MTAAAVEPAKSAFQSAMFSAPGRPRPLARRLAIHNRVVGALREFFARALQFMTVASTTSPSRTGTASRSTVSLPSASVCVIRRLPAFTTTADCSLE